MKRISLLIVSCLLILLGVSFVGSNTYATSLNSDACSGGGDACSVNLPKAVVTDTTTKSIMTIVFAVAAVLSVIFVAIGGFKYTVSSGDPSGLQSAKNTIQYALVGLVISISAYTIVQFVIGKI